MEGNGGEKKGQGMSPCTSQVNIVINGHLLPGIINGLMASTSLQPPPPSPSHVTTKEKEPVMTPKIRLTPDQREAIRLEREKTKLERERLKAEAREKKEADKRAKAEERERAKREKAAKKEKEEREKQERQAAKQAEQEQKNKEREESKRMKEKEKEERKQLAAAEKSKAKERFLGFFKKPPKPAEPKETTRSSSMMDSSQLLSFEESIRTQVVDSDYLQACKHSNATTHTPKWQRVRGEKRSSEINEDIKDDNNDIVLIEDPSGLKFFPLPKRHYKLLQFHENHRPAYYGTWSRRSKVLTPRNPFKKDNELFDYECDSDLEWEEEEPGESLSSHSGDEAESGDEDEEEDGFFVPHGYLSDGEGDLSEDEKDKREEKNLAKVKAWEAEFSRQFKKLVPLKVGVVWSQTVDESSKSLLEKFSAVSLVQVPIKLMEPQQSKRLGKRCHDNMTTPNTKSIKDFFKSPLSTSKENVARCLDLTVQSKRPKLATPGKEKTMPTNPLLVDDVDSKENVIGCHDDDGNTSRCHEEEKMEVTESKENEQLQMIDWTKCLAKSQELSVSVDCHL